MNYLIAIFAGALAIVGSWFINPPNSNYDGLKPSEELRLGATSFPASLDVLTNPVSTDSVSTVSHSGQHSNANDSIEVIEAKVGIGASTPVANTVFVGDSAGVSRWSTWATTTNLQSTNIIATASSTFQNFTGLNSTTTNATTTSLFSTTASSTNLYSSGLTPCTGSNAVQWTGGRFSCGAISGTLTSFSTTTSVDMATTTIPTALIPSTDHLIITITSSTTAPSTTRMVFNSDDTASYAFRFSVDGGVSSVNDTKTFIATESENRSPSRINILEMDISNFNNKRKTAFYKQIEYATSTIATVLMLEGAFVWNNFDGRITQIDIGNVTGSFGKGTHFSIVGY